MKFLLPLALVAACALSACNTLENRRSLYSNQKVHGPYTRELEEGTWGNPKSVDQEYAEGKKQKQRPKLIYSEKKPAEIPATDAAPVPAPDLPQQ